MSPWLSPILATTGLASLWLAGRRSWWGWVLGLADELLWVLYAVATHQYAFVLSAFAYGWVYWRNLQAWRPRRPRKGTTCTSLTVTGSVAGAV